MPALFNHFREQLALVPIGPHLDIGSGNGVKTAQFARNGIRPVGIDLALEGLRAAHNTGVEARLLQADCLVLPFKSSVFASASDALCFTHVPRGRQGPGLRRWSVGGVARQARCLTAR